MNRISLVRLGSTLDRILEFSFETFKRFNPNDPLVQTEQGRRLIQAADYRAHAAKHGFVEKATGRQFLDPKRPERGLIKQYDLPPIKTKAGEVRRTKSDLPNWQQRRQQAFALAEAKNAIPDIKKLKEVEQQQKIRTKLMEQVEKAVYPGAKPTAKSEKHLTQIQDIIFPPGKTMQEAQQKRRLTEKLVRHATEGYREQRIGNVRGYAALKLLQQRRIIHGYAAHKGINVGEAYKKIRAKNLPVYGQRLDIYRQAQLKGAEEAFQQHQADLRSRLYEGAKRLHGEVSEKVLQGHVEGLMGTLAEGPKVARAGKFRGTLGLYLDPGTTQHATGARERKYLRDLGLNTAKQYEAAEAATKTAKVNPKTGKPSLLADYTAAGERSILERGGKKIFGDVEKSPLYKKPKKIIKDPGFGRTRGLLTGLGIGAGVIGGALLARGIYRARQPQPIEKETKMSSRLRLIMFARKFPKRIGKGKIPTGHGVPLTPDALEKAKRDLLETWKGGGLTSPEVRLPPKKDIKGISQPSSEQRYVGDTYHELRKRQQEQEIAERIKEALKRQTGKRVVGGEDVASEAARRQKLLQDALDAPARFKSMRRHGKKVSQSLKTAVYTRTGEKRRVGLPFVREEMPPPPGGWTPTSYAEELLSKKYPIEGPSMVDTGQVLPTTRIREILYPARSTPGVYGKEGLPVGPGTKHLFPAGGGIHGSGKPWKSKGPAQDKIEKALIKSAQDNYTIAEENRRLTEENLKLKGPHQESWTAGHETGIGIGEEAGYERGVKEEAGRQSELIRKLQSRKPSGGGGGKGPRGPSKKERARKNLQYGLGGLGIGAGAGLLAGGATGYALTRRDREKERQLSARLREIRFSIIASGRKGEYQDSGIKPRDIAIGAVEGGIVAPFIEPISNKLLGRPKVPIFQGGWKSFGKRALIGAGLGGLATGAVGYAINKAHKLYERRRLARQANQLSSKAKEIRFGLLGRLPVTSDFAFAPQDRQRGHGSPIRVVRDRYDKEIINRERNRRDANYARTALVGGVLGGMFKKRLKMPAGRAILVGGGAGLATQALTRNLITRYQKDPYGERTVTAKRIDLAPWVGGAAVAGVVGAKRAYAKSPALQRVVKKYFEAKGRVIRFAEEDEPIKIPKGATYLPPDSTFRLPKSATEKQPTLSEQDRKMTEKWIYGRRRKTYPVAKEWGKYARRGYGFLTSAKESISGQPVLDTRGRPKKKEWEKSWVKGALITGGVAGVITAGGLGLGVLARAKKGTGAYKLAKAWGERDVGKIAEKVVPGYAPVKKFVRGVQKELRYKYDKPLGGLAANLKKASGRKDKLSSKDKRKLAKQLGQVEEITDTGWVKPPKPKKPPEEKLSSKFRPIEFAEGVEDWRITDPRGRSARVFYPGHQKRDRSEMPFYKKKGTIEAALGATVAAVPLAIWGGSRLGKARGAREAVKISERRAAAKAAKAKKVAQRLKEGVDPNISEVEDFLRKYGTPPKNWKTKPPDTHLSSGLGLIRFDEDSKYGQTAAITGGTTLTGAFIGSQKHGGRLLKEGENIEGKRVIRRHNVFWPAFHEGIGIEGGKIAEVKYKGFSPGIGKVQAISPKKFGGGRRIFVIDKEGTTSSAKRAKSMVGQKYNYNILTNNCSNFTGVCRGEPHRLSRQWRRTAAGAAIGLGGGLAASYVTKKIQDRNREFSSKGRLIQFFAGQRAIPMIKKVNRGMLSSNPLVNDPYKAAALKQYTRFPEKQAELRKELARILKRYRRQDVLFAAKEEPQPSPLITKRGVAIAGGVGAAGLGLATLPGARPFFRITARNWVAKGKGLVPGPNVGGHFVADYLEGARKGLGGKPHGWALKPFFKSAEERPHSIPGRIMKSKFMNPEGLDPKFIASHMRNFQQGGKQAVNHWDREVTWGWERDHEIISGRNPKLAERSKRDLDTKLLHQHYGKEKAMKAIDHLIEHGGLDEHEAIRQVATKGIAHIEGKGLQQDDPQVQKFFKNLATQKAKVAVGYAKESLLSPALIAGGTTTAATAALVGERKHRNGSRRQT